MKLQLMSDLHTEFHQNPLTFLGLLPFEPNLDFLLLPGDITICGKSKKTIGDVLGFLSSKARNVVYTTGNHEYYGGDRERTERTLRAVMPPNFHWLQNNEETIDGQHFFGGTLWFPYNDMNHWYERELSDFSQIQGFRDWVYEENKAFAAGAAKLITPGTIVLSHHIPSYDVVNIQYRGNNLNRFFVSDLTDIILDRKPLLWVYGHTHLRQRTKVGETDVLCNPYGYPSERKFFREYPPVAVSFPPSPYPLSEADSEV